MAQRVRQNRQTIYVKPDKATTQSYFQGFHKYSGIIFCSCCGKPYHFGYADRKNTIPVYRIRKHSDCESPSGRIGESELDEIVSHALKSTIDSQEQVCSSLEKVLTECVEALQNNTDTIDKLRKQKASRERQADSLIDTLSEGGLTEAAKKRIKDKMNAIENDIAELSSSIEQMESVQIDDSYIREKISSIKDAIADLRNFTVIDRDRILNYIDRITIYANGNLDIILKSGKTIVITNDLPMNGTNNNELPSEDSVVKTRKQDALYSMPAACQLPLRL